MYIQYNMYNVSVYVQYNELQLLLKELVTIVGECFISLNWEKVMDDSLAYLLFAPPCPLPPPP